MNILSLLFFLVEGREASRWYTDRSTGCMYPLNPSKAREWGTNVKTLRHHCVSCVIPFIYNAEGSFVSQHEFGKQNGCVSS
jgi:hypothetical protein